MKAKKGGVSCKKAMIDMPTKDISLGQNLLPNKDIYCLVDLGTKLGACIMWLHCGRLLDLHSISRNGNNSSPLY